MPSLASSARLARRCSTCSSCDVIAPPLRPLLSSAPLSRFTPGLDLFADGVEHPVDEFYRFFGGEGPRQLERLVDDDGGGRVAVAQHFADGHSQDQTVENRH